MKGYFNVKFQLIGLLKANNNHQEIREQGHYGVYQ